MEEHISACRCPFDGNLLGLIMAQPVNTGAHDHGSGRDLIDPAGIMPGARDDIHMRITQPFSGAAHRTDTVFIKLHRIKAANELDLKAQARRITNFLCALAQPRFHILHNLFFRVAEINCEHHLFRDDIA